MLDGHVFIVRQLLTDSRLLVENQSFGGQVTVDINDLYRAWGEERLKFEVTNRRIGKKVDLDIATAYTIEDFGSLDKEVRDEAWRRYKLIVPLLRLPAKERTRARLEEYAAQEQRKLLAEGNTFGGSGAEQQETKPTRANVGHAASRGSIERWLSDYICSGYDIRVLAPETKRQGGKGVSKLRPEVAALLDKVLLACAQKPKDRTLEDVEDDLRDAINDENSVRDPDDQFSVPARSTIYRHIQQVGAESILKRRPNRMEAQANRSVQAGPKTTRVLERVEIDHTTLDLMVVDETDRLPIGRPTFTFAIDHYSGMPFGLYVGFEPPSYLTVMECLLHGILPKPDVQTQFGTKNPWPVFGLPETLVIDNGREFIGQDLDDACAQLGITLERTPVKSPWIKGGVERSFRTVHTKLVHKLPGTTFSNIEQRGSYKSEKESCISLSAFREILHVFLLDQYAQGWHTGKKGVPAKLWHESVQSGFVPTLHTSADETRILLGRVDTRTVQRTGIDFENIRYQSPDVVRLRTRVGDGTSVRIKYDPSDMGNIYVFDESAQTGELSISSWLKIPALDQEYAAGLSIWKHHVLNKYLNAKKQKVNPQTLLEAKRHWQQIVRNEFLQTRKIRTRKVGARFGATTDESPSTSAPTPTTGLPTTTANTRPAPPMLGSGTPPSRPGGVSRITTVSDKDAEYLPEDASTYVDNDVDDDLDDLEDFDEYSDDDLDVADNGWRGSYDLPHHKGS